MSSPAPFIFRKYFGFGPLTPDFTEIHIPHEILKRDIQEFHLILAFATDTYDETTKTGTGNFIPTWNQVLLNAERIKTLKHKYQHGSLDVKVAVSIGGTDNRYPFKIGEKETWLENAIRSLTKIITDFNNYCGCKLIDGIDVNYESIETSEEDFVYCMGKLIERMKDDKDLNIKVASIAPSETVEQYYKKLYKYGSKYIDWVDYNFSPQINPIATVDDFIAI